MNSLRKQMKFFSKVIPFVCVLIICAPAWAAPAEFQTESSALGVEKRKLYSDVENFLNDWSGGSEKLMAAGVMIDSLIKTNPGFLPIYIEKARLAIMLGSIGKNDPLQANRDALNILADIQEKAPTYPKSYVLAGHAYLNVGDFVGARKSLEQAERTGTMDPWLYNNWADFYGRTDQYDKAVLNARKALLLSGENGKSLVTAIYFISKYTNYVKPGSRNVDIPQVVFESFKDPDQRMKVATRLIHAYSGDPIILDCAYAIIERQSKETPRLEGDALAMAEWLLAKGYSVNENNVAIYDRRFSSAAEDILVGIKPSVSANSRIFALRFSIALSNKDFARAKTLIEDAETKGIPSVDIRKSEATIKWLNGDYASVIDIFESLAKIDPSFEDDTLLAAAYSRLGQRDKLRAHFERQIQRDPTDAWALGNYAGFLLFTMNDVDGAIKFGEMALNQMNYPIAQNTTALAHLMKGSTLKRVGKLEDSAIHLRRARSIGVSEEYVFEHCQHDCTNLTKMLK